MGSEDNVSLLARKDEATSFSYVIHVVWPCVLVLLAWSFILLAYSTNHLSLIDHDYLLKTSHLPWLAALLVFLASWQIMTIAMMLPSTLSIFSLIASAGRDLRSVWFTQTVFLLGYAAVWTAFAFVAFVGDTMIHQLVKYWPWFYEHSWLIGVITLAIAGSFQLSQFKQRCLKYCGDSCIERCYCQDMKSAWYLGWRYGWYCIVMFGSGGKSLFAMAGLAMVIFVEKEAPGGQRVRLFVGIMFLILALLACILPSWIRVY
jgi:predicted metal-binding membrane protein